jgi:hypothetical protein
MNTVINELEDDMIDGIKEYVEYIKADYRKWYGNRDDEIAQKMIENFEAGVEVEVGNKYLKVITNRSVHSFVCLKDTDKFARGDILKAATWRSPARNFPRGNVITRKYGATSWTGAM